MSQLIEVKDNDRKLTGLYSYLAYSLDGDAFNDALCQDIKLKTNLDQGSLGDWWVFYDHTKRFQSWKQLVGLAICILRCEATRLFVSGLYLEKSIRYNCLDIAPKDLPETDCSGAKRVNATSVEWHSRDRTDYRDNFYLFGKEEGCDVEGSWLDWCLFACNVLASRNTRECCPELYAPTLKHNNY